MRRILLPLLVTVVSCATTAPPPAPPDFILAGGRIFTADDSRPWAEAIAIRGDRIAAVGSNADVTALAGSGTRIIELGGRVVVPGINDAHVHAPWPSAGTNVDIPQDATSDQLIAAIAAAARQKPQRTLLTASIPLALTGAPTLTRAALDSAAPNHPVRLAVLGGHAQLLNSAALREWRIAEDAPDPRGGRYGREGAFLDGWVYEHALWTEMFSETDEIPDDVIVSSMREFAEEAVRYGITSVQTMPAVAFDRVQRLRPSSGVPLRWRWMDMRLMNLAEQPTRPAKYILDGTPIERGAALRQPYADRPDERGAVNYSDDEIRRMVEVAARSNQQLLVHIAGDAALEKLFGAMRAANGDWTRKRVRIEHGDFIGSFLVEAKALGIILVQNPSHLMLPQIIPARLGPLRLGSYQVLRSVIDRGIPLALGSDGPLNPWLNVMFATIHPLNPAEALTREQAVIAYTRGSAFAEMAEHDKGTLTPGKLADLAVLSQDVFTVPPPELPKTESVLTMIGGAIVWSTPEMR